MSLDGDVRRLGCTRPFDLLPREALQLIAFSCDKTALKVGEVLFTHGEPADAAYFILSGAITLASGGAERRVESGALIGELALMTNLLRRANARAAEDVVALRIPREVFRRVLSEFPQAAAKIRAAGAARTRELLDRFDKVRARAFEA
jgi:CRP-like cAMP-binding protein